MFHKTKSLSGAKRNLIGVGLILIMLCLFVWLSIAVLNDIQALHGNGSSGQRLSLVRLLDSRKNLHQVSSADVQYINTWMTFSYINVIFNLPPDYLKNSLQIKDLRYPRLTLGRYSRANRLNQQAVITQTKNAVLGFLKAQGVN